MLVKSTIIQWLFFTVFLGFMPYWVAILFRSASPGSSDLTDITQGGGLVLIACTISVLNLRDRLGRLSALTGDNFHLDTPGGLLQLMLPLVITLSSTILFLLAQLSYKTIETHLLIGQILAIALALLSDLSAAIQTARSIDAVYNLPESIRNVEKET